MPGSVVGSLPAPTAALGSPEPMGGSICAASVPARAHSIAAPFPSLIPTVEGNVIGGDSRRNTRCAPTTALPLPSSVVAVTITP